MLNVRQFISLLISITLIAVGVLLLLSNFNYISFDPITTFLNFWPILLILIGIYLIWGRSRARNQSSHKAIDLSEDIGSAKKASFKIDFGAGELTLGSSIASDKLFDGNFLFRPNISLRQTDETAFTEIKQAQMPWASTVNHFSGDVWKINLNKNIPTTLEINTGASRLWADFLELNLTDLNISTGASDITIRLPKQSDYTHTVLKGGAATMQLEIPDGVAARIKSTSALANISVNKDRFPKSENYYISPDYDSAAKKIDIDISAGFSSVTIV